MRVAKTDNYDEKSALEDHIYLIKYAARLFSRKISPARMDYDDLYGEGELVLTVCLAKWGEGNRSNTSTDFSRYFKTALFRRYNFLRYTITKKDYEVPTYSIDNMVSLKIQSDGGFNELAFQDLCNHVASGLRQPDRAIFSLIINPPVNLTNVVLKESQKREKHVDNPCVKLRGRHLIKYLNGNGYPMKKHQLDYSLKRIRSRVRQVLNAP